MVALHSAVLDSITLLTPWTHRSVLHPCAHRHRSSAADLFTAPLALPVSTAAARPVYREGGRSASSPAARLHQSLELSSGPLHAQVHWARNVSRERRCGCCTRCGGYTRSCAPLSTLGGARCWRAATFRAARWATGRTAWTLPPRTSRRYENRTARVTRWVGTHCHVYVGGERRQCHVVSGCVCSSSSRAVSHKVTHAPPATVAFTSGVSG
jgi:hypothetical protein